MRAHQLLLQHMWQHWKHTPNKKTSSVPHQTAHGGGMDLQSIWMIIYWAALAVTSIAAFSTYFSQHSCCLSCCIGRPYRGGRDDCCIKARGKEGTRGGRGDNTWRKGPTAVSWKAKANLCTKWPVSLHACTHGTGELHCFALHYVGHRQCISTADNTAACK